MRLVDTGGSFIMQSDGTTVGYTYTFEDNANVVNYFVSAVDDEIELDVNLIDYSHDNAYVYVTILGGVPGEVATNFYSGASLRYVTDIDLSSTNWQFEFQLEAYELIELHIVVGQGVVIEGDSQNAINDILTGSNYGDHLSGGLGDDTLLGGGGRDELDGGDGDDVLDGGVWDDILIGGQGNDRLLGGSGRDELNGGDGDDFLDGGAWNDTLVGGDGNDILLGGDGNDLLNMGDGNGVAIGGAGEDTLTFIDASEGVSIWRAAGVVELAAYSVDFSEIEIFQGSQYDDRFYIIGDEEFYLGQSGNDVFQLMMGGENTIYSGSGDDTIFVYSDGGNNRIFGESGDDTFYSLGGTNQFSGGTGSDTFYLASIGRDALLFRTGDGADEVYNFRSGIDQIELFGFALNDINISMSSTGTLLDFGVHGSIFLDGTFEIIPGHDLLFL
jgi:Ca2+-binding RTX toxin-like protein